MMILIAVFIHLSVAQINFFVISDLHYDIAYQSNYGSSSLCHSVGIEGKTILPVMTNLTEPIGRYSCDSSLKLVNLTIQKMQEVNYNPDFIVVLGDHIAHYTASLLNKDGIYDANADRKLVRDSFKKVYALFEFYFPRTQVIPVIGNNDGYKDYTIPDGIEGNEYLKFLHDL